MNNDVFLSKWKIQHDKGILIYALQHILPVVIVLLLTAIYFSLKNQANTSEIFELIKYNIFAILFYSLLTLFNWFRSEQKYKKAIDERIQ